MKRSLLAITIVLALVVSAQGDHPKPSPYPTTWEFKFEHGTPKRVVVSVPEAGAPQAYWYMTYTVTNNTDKEQIFIPVFEMLTEEGKVTRSDRNIPPKTFEAIKQREGNKLLERAAQIAGEIRIGEAEARDGVAIWPEPMAEMGRFTIFISGLSGETATVQTAAGDKVVLRKTLQLDYHVRGDEVFPGEDPIDPTASEWIMR